MMVELEVSGIRPLDTGSMDGERVVGASGEGN